MELLHTYCKIYILMVRTVQTPLELLSPVLGALGPPGYMN